MALSPDEVRLLQTVANEVHETHEDMAATKGELIRLGGKSRAHDDRLDRHDFRIGTLESTVGVPVGGGLGPIKTRREILASMPPPDVGSLQRSPTGSHVKMTVKEAQALLLRAKDADELEEYKAIKTSARAVLTKVAIAVLSAVLLAVCGYAAHGVIHLP